MKRVSSIVHGRNRQRLVRWRVTTKSRGEAKRGIRLTIDVSAGTDSS
jgi:hypothetical protein